MKKLSVLLVDDHSLVRRGFRRILEDAADVSGLLSNSRPMSLSWTVLSRA
jgi:DNA-binding NarL/FixJ family response regulator